MKRHVSFWLRLGAVGAAVVFVVLGMMAETAQAQFFSACLEPTPSCTFVEAPGVIPPPKDGKCQGDGASQLGFCDFTDFTTGVVVSGDCPGGIAKAWNDIIVGSPFDDTIDAGEGNDIVCGLAGNDHINGGNGDDDLFGGSGDDVIAGGNGNDRLVGNDGHDVLFGDAGNDSLNGGAGDDVCVGGIGVDFIGLCEVVVQETAAPVANAGENLTITSRQQCDTVIQGTASDLDSDALQYRWLEGGTVIFPWASVGPHGEAYLDLCPVALGLGQHTLTLEVSDGQATSRDDMLLTIDNAAPHAAPTGGGVYHIGTPITVGGQVSDFDGDGLTYIWSEGTTTYCTGQVHSVAGGTPVSLPDCDLPSLGLGTHIVTLTVSDGINEPFSRDITIEVVDTTAPTLAPESNVGILWPPNHQMVDILIQTKARDESGLPVWLRASITSNEPQEGLGDGDMAPDWLSPVIDQTMGVIALQLRAERSGLGDGRTYTVAITATDEAGNTSTATVEIIVPHDQSAKK